ncbi:D5 family NTPase [Largemouth bass ulcerative syndrome virus]|uniref:D5 family NTPase n=1 Tax=Spotted knifejaw iridovirus TaxID=655341 RepID=A0A8F9RV37_ISKNV|nr:D5 family NTPase [Spotted knifejaw iridovirus]WEP24644.1 D5 family NTPase [Largemouth bass ulcerative syndrome virus]
MSLSGFLAADRQQFGDSGGSTHVSLTGGSYIIDDDKVTQLWAYLQDATEPLHLAECRAHDTMLTIDVDYRAPSSEQQLYGIDSHVMPLHREVMHLLGTCVTGGIRAEDCSFVLLEKLDGHGNVMPPQQCDSLGNVKQGFHMQYTKIIANTHALTEYIIKPLNAAFPDVDLLSCSNAWLLYGACKPGGVPYTVTGHYGADEQPLPGCAWQDYCFPASGNLAITGLETHDTMLRKMLSVVPYGRMRYKRRLRCLEHSRAPGPSITHQGQQQLMIQQQPQEPMDVSTAASTTTPADVRALVDMLPASAAADRNTWLKVGFCLYQVMDATEDGLRLWMSFSAKCPEKFNATVCHDMWERQMRPNTYTVATLRYLAKQYSTEAYDAWTHSQWMSAERLKLTHVSLASIMYSALSTHYVCGNIKGELWYKFDNGVWNEKGMNVIRSLISNEAGPIHQVLNKFLAGVASGQVPEPDESFLKCLHRTTFMLGSSPFKSSVMRECAEQFYRDDFVQRLDTNPYMIAFSNGVYDFKTRTFRPGQPEDMLSRTLPVAYTVGGYGRYVDDILSAATLDPLSNTYNVCALLDNIETVGNTMTAKQPLCDVIRFYNTTFPDPEVREYFLRQVSHVFVGGNADKVCLFWTGSGNNGKTVTQTMFEKMLGSFAVKLSTTVLTGRKPCVTSANPELARLRNGVRWAVMEEPNNDETINPGPLKSMTGNDSFFARDLWCSGKETSEIIPMFKLHCICNTLPDIKMADMATWNRVRVVPFEAVFVSGERLEEARRDVPVEQRDCVQVMDKYFVDKIPLLVEPMAWLLVQLWGVLQGEPADAYKTPRKVIQVTKEYEEANNYVRGFADAMMVHEPGASVTEMEVYREFKAYMTAYGMATTAGYSITKVMKDLVLYLKCRYDKRSGHLIDVMVRDMATATGR